MMVTSYLGVQRMSSFRNAPRDLSRAPDSMRADQGNYHPELVTRRTS
ncbi:MAG TPA: hypothetical protein VHG08_11685 [Longimicrobium sp.]|nr:hypothetical protein [Longimicrobium sp.]